MAGLLDFIGTPEGQGLLSAAFGGLAGARRGAPLNSIGIAGLSGLQGYQSAQQQGVMNQYRDLQAKKIEADLAQQQGALDYWKGGGAPASSPQPTGVFTEAGAQPGASGVTGVFTQPQAPIGSTISPEMIRRGLLSGNPIVAKQARDMAAGLKDLAPTPVAGGSFTINSLTGERQYMPKVSEGMTLDNSGQAVNLPGYVQSNAQAKGAEAAAVEGAKYPYVVGADRAKQQTAAGLDLIQVPMQDGTTVMMPRSLAAQGTGNPALAGGGFGRSPNPAAQNATQKINENFITNSYQPTIDGGAAAGSMLGNIAALRNVNAETGWGTEAKAAAANMLTGFGLAPKEVEAYASDVQKFQSITMSHMMKEMIAQKGAQTEGDAKRAQQTYVKLSNTPEANVFMMDFAEAKANMDQRKAKFYEMALPLAQKNGDLQRIDREWRKVQGSIWNDPVLSRWK